MLFVDQVSITAKGGEGGRGCLSFAQPPYTRYPYPDGGDGGDGGHVILRADSNVATLLDFQYRHEFAGTRGSHGGSNQKKGKRGDDLVIAVPLGTVVYDQASGEMLRDLTHKDEEFIAAAGGRGGLGNATIAESQKRAIPRRAKRARSLKRVDAPEATPGAKGEKRLLRLELKLIADVGIIGFPNAGKSSLLARISTARPKIGAYPFTTRYPVLGVVDAGSGRSFVACDIPGLIEGAHTGKGLGAQFLRHIERTRILVHLIDMAAIDGKDPVKAYAQVNKELRAYSPALARKMQLIVANKMDLPEAQENLKRAKGSLPPPIFAVSAATGKGVRELVSAIADTLKEIPEKEGLDEEWNPAD